MAFRFPQRTSRWFTRFGIGLALASLLGPMAPGPVPASANSTLADRLGLPETMIPVEFGQTQLTVFVPETSHTVGGTMLDYWRANGASAVYGNPISEVFGAPNGLFSQAFERGIFQYNPDWTQTDNPTVRLMPLGKQLISDRATDNRADGRRTRGDRRKSAWVRGVDNPERTAEVAQEGGRFSDETGYSIAGEFQDWYDSHEGWFYAGAPLSEPMRERGVTLQYFENTLLVATSDGVVPAPLPGQHPELYGFSTQPVKQGDLPEFSESLFYSTANPYGVDPATVPGRKYIVVNLAEQTLYAYQGDQLILQTYVSTGVDPNTTEVGYFHVRIKFLVKDMAGVTDGSGRVTGVGQQSGDGSGYLVEDVPNVMFFNYEAEALHGAYWHNNFGQRMSHGCVNLPLDVSAFLYEWAPLGTAVTVVEN